MDLPNDLSDAERRVVEHAARGEVCELGTGEPSQGGQWGEERVVRASVIYALCCAAHGGSAVHAKGVGEVELAEAQELMKADRPATLDDQLGWLGDAGYRQVECPYEDGMFAVFGGIVE